MAAPAHKDQFSIKGRHFLLNGEPFVIRSGEIHYSRVPKPYWRHRLEMARAMGLNAVCPYLFWNYHEETCGEFDYLPGVWLKAGNNTVTVLDLHNNNPHRSLEGLESSILDELRLPDAKP